MRFNYDPLVLKKARTAVIAYAVGILIAAGLFFVPMLLGQTFEWSYQHLIFAFVTAFLMYQLFRSIRLCRAVRASFVSVEREAVTGTDNCRSTGPSEPFSVRPEMIRSAEIIRKDVLPIGRVRAIRLVCDDDEHVVFGIGQLDELLLELMKYRT